MKIELWIISWILFAVAAVYWDMHRWEDVNPISKCHNAEILIYHDRPMCTECKLYCEVVDGRRGE